jgi:hypothetical protein
VLDTCFSGNLFDLAYHWKSEIHNGQDTPGHVFLISSSQEDEYSYEYKIPGPAGGFTLSYVDTIKTPQTWNSLMEQVSQKLTQMPALQTPELSTGQQENLDASFEI